MMTVDQLVAEERKRRSVHFVLPKVDVDGPEIDVLPGSTETLALSTVLRFTLDLNEPADHFELGR